METFTILPQLAQLEVHFSGPLVKESQVENLIDLTSLNTRYAYTHKMVWVIAEKANYYLSAGNGSVLSNWTKLVSKATISAYKPDQTYESGEICFQNGMLYSAKMSVPLATYPSANIGTYWEQLATESISTRILFTDAANFVFETTIKNPTFTVFIGTFMVDIDGNPVYDSNGFRKLSPCERVEATIIPRGDLTETSYELQFYTDSVMAVPELTDGYILVK